MRIYRAPFSLIVSLALSLAARRPRSISADSRRLIAVAPVAPILEGVGHIPRDGPLLVTANHYARRGLGAWWAPPLIIPALAERRGHEPVWIMTSEWYYNDPIRSALITPITRRLFPRAAEMYGCLPMPPNPVEVVRRGRAVGMILRRAREIFARGGTMGLMPEGRGEQELLELQPGAGRFLLQLASGVPVLPVGIFEREGRLAARFGPSYRLEARPGESKAEAEARGRFAVMTAIAELLPEEMRGVYG